MIRVIIEREIVEGLEPFYEAAIADLLDVVAGEPGFLSGESLVELHRPNHYVVITRWTNEEAWNRWVRSPRWQELTGEMRPFLQNEETFTLLRQLRYHRGG